MSLIINLKMFEFKNEELISFMSLNKKKNW